MAKTQSTDPQIVLTDLAREYSQLASRKDRASGFRRRMIRGRAQSLICKFVKGARAQEEAFEAWDRQTKPAAKPFFATVLDD